MELLKQHFRIWWRYPRSLGNQPEHRTVSFLELFYDLVYVVLIAELAHGLAAHPDGEHVAKYFFLFIIVWWSWFNGTAYHDLHGNNDIRTRVLTFMQMICVAAMAAFAHQALGEGSILFAISYGCFQLILAFMWWRVEVYDPKHGALSKPYSRAFLIAAILFLTSVFWPEHMRPYVWTASVLFTLILPVVTLRQAGKHQDLESGLNVFLSVSPSLIERFGLFTIIVLGEVIVGAVSGVRSVHPLTVEAGVLALLGVLMAAGLWWVYFDFVSHRQPKASRAAVISWIYLHLPFTASIAAAGAALLIIVEHAGEEVSDEATWLLTGSVALALFCVSQLNRTIKLNEALKSTHITGGRTMLACALIIVGLGILDMPAVLRLVLTVVLLLIPVYLGLLEWVRAQVMVQVDEEV